MAISLGIVVNANWVLLQSVPAPSTLTPNNNILLGQIVAAGAGVPWQAGYGLGYRKGSGDAITINNVPYTLIHNDPENILFGFAIDLS